MTENTHVSDLLPNRPIGSPYEVALLYSLCSEYEKRQELEDLHGNEGFGLPIDVLRYLTPNEVSADEETRIVAARLDLTGDEPRFDSDSPVEVEAFSDDLKFRLGHIYNQGKSGAAIDHSVTNHLGSTGDDVETIAHDTWGNRYLRGRFERWATSDPVSNVGDEDWDYNIIEAMQEIAGDEAEMQRLKEALLAEYDPDDSLEGFVTVKVRVDEEKGYQYPGEFDELNYAGVEMVNETLRQGRSSINDSYSEDGIGMISDDEEDVVVGASDGIFASYGKKQRDAFPDLNPDMGWQQRPLSEPIAKAITGFNSLEDSFSFTSNELLVAYLPYPRETVTREVFERFYEDVYTELKARENPFEYVETLSEMICKEVDVDDGSGTVSELEESTVDDKLDNSVEDDDDLHLQPSDYALYTVLAQRDQNSVYNIYVEELNSSVKNIIEVNNKYADGIVYFSENGAFSGLFDGFEDSGFRLLDEDATIIPSILYGDFIEQAGLPALDAAETGGGAGTSQDQRLEFTGSLLRGEGLNPDQLLETFVTKTEREHRDAMSDNEQFPALWPVVQAIQLHALDEAGMITETDKNGTFKIGDVPPLEQENVDLDNLQEFIESYDALSTDSEKAVFITGGLVGYLSVYQDGEDISQTLVSQYPISSVNRRSIYDLVSDVLEKREEYSDVEGFEIGHEYRELLPKVMLEQDPEEWEMSNAEMRWFYSLGIAYGKNNRYSSYNTD